MQANCNRLLDVARETYKENVGDIYQLSNHLSEQHKLPLTPVYQGSGFVFTLKKDELEGELPKGFINVAMQKGKWLFSSLELVGCQIVVETIRVLICGTEKNECQDEGCP
jgi:DNA mismatch repair protein MSH4